MSTSFSTTREQASLSRVLQISLRNIAEQRGSRKSLAAIPCATYKASKGYTMSELQELLGYERPGTSLIYTHMARDPRQLMMQTG
jgi:hypothetical protein